MLSRLFCVLLLMSSAVFAADPGLQHYIYINHREAAGENIRADKGLQDPRFSGAQIVYKWRDLEPVKGHYDFSSIKADIAWLSSKNKKLWIQLQDKSFSPRPNVPDYIMQDPIYKGGVIRQSMLSAPERDPNKPVSDDDYGLVSKMWEPPVRERYQALIRQLGRELDGKIAGINFNESSVDIGTENADGTTTFPADFSPEAYVNALGDNMRVLAGAFKQSHAMVYLNFLPDEWLPDHDKGYMRRLFTLAQSLKMGVGGPDLMPYRKGHMLQSYGFIKDYPAALVKGMAVQDGNLRQINPKTGKKNTVADLLDFGGNYLGLDYIFWVEDEPYFTNEVLKQLPAKPRT
ncbi:MAG: hypothetical protein ACRCU9_02300 [Iodobacter sp.]